METPTQFDNSGRFDEMRNGRLSLMFLIADLIGRTIIVVAEDTTKSFGGQHVLAFKPGFCATFADLPEKTELLRNAVLFLVSYLNTCLYISRIFYALFFTECGLYNI